jgi:bilirubin oxidase
LGRNGVIPQATQQGRKDVILIGPLEIVRFNAEFEDFSNPTVPYMYHCNMLYHKDRGMMEQFFLIDKTASIQNKILNQIISIYPNSLSEGMFKINMNRTFNKENRC